MTQVNGNTLGTGRSGASRWYAGGKQVARSLGMACALLLAPVMAWAQSADPQRWQLNMGRGVTSTSQNAYDAHMIALWICVVIGALVFGAMAVAMFKFRKSKGAVAATFSHNTTAEIIWTVIPILILVVMAIPATKKLIAMYDTRESELTVKVTGYQWMWKYEYLGEGVEFTSRLDRESDRLRQNKQTTQAELAAHPHYLLDVDNALVLPVDTKVRFVITADDVIHAWWVPAQFSHNTTAEIIWTVIPVLILVVMAWPATAKLIAMYDTRDAEMTVKVTGYQWMWKYDYLGEDVSFTSRLDRESDRIRQSGEQPDYAKNPHYLLDVDNPLVLPTNTKIRFVITADDVIHAWWVPALGWKQDAIPGIVNEAWTDIKEPGIYRGQCAELCGKDHGFMPIVVKAVPKAEFEQWLASKKPAPAAEPAPAAPEAAPADAAPATDAAPIAETPAPSAQG